MNEFSWYAPIWIGDIRVRVRHNEIVINDEVHRLQPKVMDVFCALIEAGGNVVTKTDLIERVWPNMMVPERVLVDAVYQLRRSLGDDAKTPQVIRTIPRRGYCLAADIRSESEDWFESQPFSAGPHILLTKFKNLGPEYRNRNFCEGLADDLIHLVGLTPGLSVLGTIPTPDDRSLSVRALKSFSQLGATHLISGSMRRHKGCVRVVARLIDARSGTQIWSGVFNHEETDPLRAQELIAESIVIDVAKCLVS